MVNAVRNDINNKSCNMAGKLYLKATGRFATDRFSDRLSPINGHQTLFYPSKERPVLSVDIFANEFPTSDQIESVYLAEVSTELFDAVTNGISKYALPPPLLEQFNGFFTQIQDWTNEVLRYLKYCLNFVELSESPFGYYANGEFWSVDSLTWTRCTPENEVHLTGISSRESSSRMAVLLMMRLPLWFNNT